MPPQARARCETFAVAAPWLRSVALSGSTAWLRGVCPGSTSYSPNSVGKSGLDRGSGMQGSEHGDRGDGGAGKIGRDILRNAGKTEDVDVQHLASLPGRFEIGAAVVPQTEVQTFARGGLLDDVGVAPELIADRRSDEVGAVRIEPVLNHQIDVAQIDITKIDRDFFSFGRLCSKFGAIRSHDLTIQSPSAWMVYGGPVGFCKG